MFIQTISFIIVSNTHRQTFDFADNRKEDVPRSPGDVTVCTPPGENMAFMPCITITSTSSGKRQRQDEELSHEQSLTGRRHTLRVVREETSETGSIVNNSPTRAGVLTARSSGCYTNPVYGINLRRRGIALDTIDLDGLPFFQFQRMMRSSG